METKSNPYRMILLIEIGFQILIIVITANLLMELSQYSNCLIQQNKMLTEKQYLEAEKQYLEAEKIIKEQKVYLYLSNEILPCPICGVQGYLHKAVNDMEHPSWTVDCTVYDKKGYEHDRVGKKWQNSKSEAISMWNNAR